MLHKYSLGQSVRYKNKRSLETLFSIVQQMPAEEATTALRYKIKAIGEEFARVALESELVPTVADSSSEIHRVFAVPGKEKSVVGRE